MLWDQGQYMVNFGRMWWLIPIIPSLERQSQKDCIEFKTNWAMLSSRVAKTIMSSKPSWAVV